MTHHMDHDRGAWPAAMGAAMVGADPARRVVQTVEGPTLHDREIGFGRGLASSDRSPTCFGRSSRAYARSTGPGRSSRRLRRAASWAIAVIAFAIVASGCGGGATADPAAAGTPAAGADPSATTVAGTGTDPSAPSVTGALTSAAGEDIPGANEISNANAAVGASVKVSATTPKKFRDAHCSEAIMVVYYQPGSVVDEKLLQQATNAAASAGDVLMLVYTPRDVKSAGDLPSKLGLFSTPGLATVGRNGKIANFWVTYVDQSLIKYSLMSAKAAKPCKVGSGDVPAAGAALKDATIVASGGKLEDASTDPLAGGQPGTPAVDAAGATDPTTGLPTT